MTTYGHRTGRLDVRVNGARPGDRVVVSQASHQFAFGNIGFELLDAVTAGAVDEAFARDWLALFNQATLPFYWRQFEPTEGAPNTDPMMDGARWFADRGVRLKGHPLVWHTLAPQWLLGRSAGEVERALRERITRDVTRFAGLVDEWDAINEAVIMPRFVAEANAITPLAANVGSVEMVRLAFETARAANDRAKLVLNDFLLTDEYARLIADCLDAGIDIDAIGLQTHMHQGFRGEDELGQILEQFGTFGLPLQLTETTLVSGDLMPEHIDDLNDYQVEHWPSTPEGEERQADDIARHYRMCVAHPLVESVTYWGLQDGAMWLGAPGGLVRADGTRKPAYDTLEGLIRGEWWVAPTEHVVGVDGRIPVSGWGGCYRIEGPAGSAKVTVEAGQSATATATLV